MGRRVVALRGPVRRLERGGDVAEEARDVLVVAERGGDDRRQLSEEWLQVVEERRQVVPEQRAEGREGAAGALLDLEEADEEPVEVRRDLGDLLQVGAQQARGWVQLGDQRVRVPREGGEPVEGELRL